MRWLATLVLFVCSNAFLIPQAYAQQAFPNKTVKIIVGFPPGNGTDVIARWIADRMAHAFGQPVIVDNRPGQGGSIGLAALAKSPPDGYTLMLTAMAAVAISPHLYATVGYDPLKDIEPIGLIGEAPLVLVAHPDLSVTSVKGLIAYAKANPDRLSYASTGKGTMSHLAMETLKQANGIRMTHIPYQGSARAMTDLINGNVSVAFDSVAATRAFIQAKKVKLLAVGSASRLPWFPDVPTVAESGLPGFVAAPWVGMIAPAGTPRPAVETIGAELTKIAHEADFEKRLADFGFFPMTRTSPEFAALVKSDFEKFRALVLEAHAKAD